MNIEAPWVLNFVKDIWIMFIPDLSEPLIFPDLGKIASSRRILFLVERDHYEEAQWGHLCSQVQMGWGPVITKSVHLTHLRAFGKGFFYFRVSLKTKTKKHE